MGRKPIGAEPLTNAQKQARFKARQLEKIESLEIEVKTLKAELETTKLALTKTESKTERRKRETKEAKENEHKSYRRGCIVGKCESAFYFVDKNVDRADIAQFLLSYFMISRKDAETALQADNSTRSPILEMLDKHITWYEPPPLIW